MDEEKQSEKSKCRMVLIERDTLADCLRAAAEYVADCDAAIFDLKSDQAKSGNPCIVIYEAR